MNLKFTSPAKVKDVHASVRTIHDIHPYNQSTTNIMSPNAFQDGTESRPRSSKESLTRDNDANEGTQPLSAFSVNDLQKKASIKSHRSTRTQGVRLRGTLTKAIKDATRSIRQNVPSPLKGSESTTTLPTDDVLSENTFEAEPRISRSGSSHSLNLHPEMALPSTCPCQQHHQYLLFDEVLPFKLGHVVQALFKRDTGAPGLPEGSNIFL